MGLCLKMVREHARKARTIDEEAHLILRKMQEERERLEALMDSSAVKMEYWRNQLKGLRKKWGYQFDESQRWQRAADKIYVKRHK